LYNSPTRQVFHGGLGRALLSQAAKLDRHWFPRERKRLRLISTADWRDDMDSHTHKPTVFDKPLRGRIYDSIL